MADDYVNLYADPAADAVRTRLSNPDGATYPAEGPQEAAAVSPADPEQEPRREDRPAAAAPESPTLPQIYNVRGGKEVLQPNTPENMAPSWAGTMPVNTPMGAGGLPAGGALGGGQGPQGPIPQGQPPMSHAEVLHMQRLQNALGMVRQQVASGQITPEMGKEYEFQINGLLGPMQMRQQMDRANLMHAQAQMATTAAQQHGQALGAGAQALTSQLKAQPVVGPDGQVVGHVIAIPDGKGGLHIQHFTPPKPDHTPAVEALAHAREQIKQDSDDFHETIKALTTTSKGGDGKETTKVPDMTNPDDAARVKAHLNALRAMREARAAEALPAAQWGDTPENRIFQAAKSAKVTGDNQSLADLRMMADTMAAWSGRHWPTALSKAYDEAEARVKKAGHFPPPPSVGPTDFGKAAAAKHGGGDRINEDPAVAAERARRERAKIPANAFQLPSFGPKF